MRRKRLKDKYTIIDKLTSTYQARIKFNEVDALGIVWHGNYVNYFEEGREAFGRQYGMSYLDIKNSGFVTPITDLKCSYKLSLKYGDTYTIKTYYVKTTAAKIIHVYELFNQKEELVCEGETTQVFLDNKGNLCLYFPEFYHDWRLKMNIDE